MGSKPTIDPEFQGINVVSDTPAAGPLPKPGGLPGARPDPVTVAWSICNEVARLGRVVSAAQWVRDNKDIVDGGVDQAHLDEAVERLCAVLEEVAM